METDPSNSLTHELLEMAAVDQDMRTKAQEDMKNWDESIDQRNTARLKEIVAESGWPTISKVGTEASSAAWLLVQHAYADPDFMKECLALMKQASEGDVVPANIAYLEDRLLTMEDKPQLYGTQFYYVGKRLEPFPIEDPDHVDERRASVGLEPLADHVAKIKAMYGSEDAS